MGFADCLDCDDDEGGEAGFGREGPQEWNGSEWRDVLPHLLGDEGMSMNAFTPVEERKRAK